MPGPAPLHGPFRRALTATALVAVTLLAACDSTNPVAPRPDPAPPAGGNFNVSVRAVPAELQAGTSQPATVTVEVTQTANNLPPADGTPVALSTSLGSFGVNDDANPTRTTQLSLAGGRAQVSLFPGSAVGTARVLAQVGENTAQAEVAVLEALPSNFFVSGVTPGSGHPDGGEPVTVLGAGFRAPLRVTFGALQATVRQVTDTAIEVDTPIAPQPLLPGMTLPVDVTVVNDLSSEEPATDTLTGGFLYTLAASPTFFVAEVTPNRGPAAGGTAVTVRGQGFRSPLRVEMGGIAVTGAAVVSASEIRLITPPAPRALGPGETLAVDVTVVNALGEPDSSSATLVGAFTYQQDALPVIVIRSLEPQEGPLAGGTTVTLTGQGFTPGNPVAVELAGVRQRMEQVVDATTVTFVTAGTTVAACPAGGRLVQAGVRVTDLATQARGESGDSFTYLLDAPRIRRVTPGSGSQFGANVVIEGEGFAGSVRVELTTMTETLTAEVRQVTPTRIDVRTPAVPDTFFPEVDCVTANNTAGKRFVEVTLAVQVTHLDNGCSDVFGGVFTYQPANPSCREVTPP